MIYFNTDFSGLIKAGEILIKAHSQLKILCTHTHTHTSVIYSQFVCDNIAII